MHAEPQSQHKWLAKLVGEWTYEHECVPAEGKPVEKLAGTERVRRLGELWVLCEGRGPMPDGAEATMLMSLGYDPARQKFVGSWIGSMMTHMWVYEGELDPSGRVLTLNAEGPSFTAPGKTARYQDVIEFKSDDHRTLTSRCLGEDGTWTQFMQAHYRRKAV
jgi:hypothetical protein